MDAYTIFLIILLASASALCIALIFYIRKIVNSVDEIKNRINDLSAEIKPLVASVADLSIKLNDIVEEAKEPVEKIKDLVDTVKGRVEQILNFEQKIRGGVEGPVMGFVKNISAVANGVNTFWNTYKRKNNT